MQPTYLPWMGYFDLIDQSDVFIFLDTVQFEKQSWQQRNRIKTANGPLWLTVPVYQSLKQKIVDVRIDNTKNWRRNHSMSMVNSYRRSPFWTDYWPQLEAAYGQDWNLLVELNIHLIGILCEMLLLKPRFVRASDMPNIEGEKTKLLIDICRKLGADTYLSPLGSRAYLESDAEFRKVEISLLFHQYEHPIYPQLYGPFLPHLSIVDLLLNVGPKAIEAIRSGRRKPIGEMRE
jgi:hypothetical protein